MKRRLYRRGGAGRIPDEVDDEVRFHLEATVAKLVAAGWSEDEARREALRRFGDVEEVKREMSREAERHAEASGRGETLDGLRQDVGYALRQLIRQPGFALVTILTLTLGIGATTGIFSVVDGILFRPLPFDEPEELVAVWSDWTRRGGPADEWPNFPVLWTLDDRSRSLEAVGIYTGGGGTLTGRGEPQPVQGVTVNRAMFADVLRVEPALGRLFSPEEDRPGAAGTALLSHGFWQRVFGGDPSVVGQSLTLSGTTYTVVGVMGEDFRPPFQPGAEVWLPLRMDMADHRCGRGNACMLSIARLADGVALETARAEAADIGRQLEAEDPEANTGTGFTLRPLQADLVADARTALLVLLAAAALVLLIACVNVANLLVARGTARRTELAVRAALGAARRRIVGQLLTESVILAVAGGALGIGLAYLTTDLLVASAPPGTPRIDGVAVNGRVLGFAAAATMLAGILFGVLPALSTARADLTGALREGGRGAAAGSGRVRAGLVVAQVALALVLLVGSGLLIRSFQNLRTLDLGFRPSGVLTFGVGLPGDRYPDRASIVALLPELEARLAAVPGVTQVGATANLPLSGGDHDTSFNVEGRPIPPPGQSQAVWYRESTPGYLDAMGIRIVAGRGILPSDDASASRVVVINETFAERFFPGESAVGKRININDPADPVWREIVGVAADIRNFGVRDETRTAMYVPFAQVPTRFMSFAVRTDGDPSALVAAVRRAVAEMDPQLAVASVAPLTDVVRDALATERFLTLLLTLFAGVALALAVVGLYGVVSYGVNSRLREMGVRLALGASGGAVGTLVVRRSLVLVGVGIGLGVVGALLLTRLMGALLFGVSASDPATFLGTAAVLSLVATLAAAIPARRAARVDPVRVLNAE